MKGGGVSIFIPRALSLHWSKSSFRKLPTGITIVLTHKAKRIRKEYEIFSRFLSLPTLGFDFKRKIEFFNELWRFFKNSVRYQCIHSWISTINMKDVSWGRGPRGSINCITAAPWSLCNFPCLVRCGQGMEIPVFSIIQGEWTQSSSLIEVHRIQGTLQNLIYCIYSENLQLSSFSYFYKISPDSQTEQSHLLSSICRSLKSSLA